MLENEKSIGARITSGAFWTVGMRLSIRMLGLISVIVLARLLVPEDFGIVAKASMIASFLELVTTFGLEAALIHNQKAVTTHYDTVWTIHVLRGGGIGLGLIVLANPAASFLREPALASILWFYALAAMLNGLQNVGVVDFRKNLEFDRDFRFSLYRKLAGFLVTVSIAFVWRSYWAFVMGVVAAAATAVTTSFLMSPYRPRFSLQEWRSLFHFSKWIFLVGIVGSVSAKLDTFILSRFSTTEVVGRYSVAYEIAGAASTEIAMPIARATLPGLAKLNENPAGFRETYQMTILVMLLVAIPAGVGVSAVAGPLTEVVLGSQWSASAPLIEVLALFGIVRTVFAASSAAFMSSGNVRALGQLSVVSLILRAVFLGFGFAMGGVIGLAWGFFVAGILQMVLSLYVQQHLAFLNVRLLSMQVWRMVVAAAIMYGSLKWLLPELGWLEGFPMGLSLVLQVLGGALIFAGGLTLLWRIVGDNNGPEKVVWEFFKNRWQGIKGEGAAL